MRITGILEAINFPPLYWAAVTVWVFFWLDAKAKPEIKNAISRWVNDALSSPLDIRTAIVGSFDTFYTYPLLRIRALFRSFIWTVVCNVLFLIYVWLYYGHLAFDRTLGTFSHTIVIIGQFVLSDYLSLFFVRRCLMVSSRRVVFTLSLAFIGGCAMVIILSFIIGFLKSYVINLSVLPLLSVNQFTKMYLNIELSDPLGTLLGNVPGLLVHVWLVLFVVGSFGMSIFFAVFRAIRWAQWFLDQGNKHPLSAIGMVAGATVFLGGVAYTSLARF